MQLRDQELCIFGEDRRPIQIHKAIGETLRAGDVFDPDKDVVVLGVADLMGREFACKPLVSIQIDLDLQRKPGLNTYMDQTKVAIHEVEVPPTSETSCG